MLNHQIEALSTLLKDEDLQNYTGDAFWNLIQAVINQDPFTGLSSIKNVKDLIFHMPTVLFWDKMQRFLFGTYKNWGEQIKMACRFNTENNRYADFVKKQIFLINEIDDDDKIDYYASLTRCLLVMEMELPLYFKLAKFLVLCTPYELEFIKNTHVDIQHENSAIISTLYQYGLFEQAVNNTTSEVYYKLSSFGQALKECSLNYEDENIQHTHLSYSTLQPLEIVEPLTIKEF